MLFDSNLPPPDRLSYYQHFAEPLRHLLQHSQHPVDNTSAMAVQSPSRSKDVIDPHRPAEFPVVLGDSLLNDADSSTNYIAMRYNWLPKVPPERLTGNIKRASADSSTAYTLHLNDADRRDRDYFYGGNSTGASSGDLILVFNKAESVFRLESLSSALDFNLTSASGQSLSDIQNHAQLPKSDARNGAGHTKLSQPEPSEVNYDESAGAPDDPYDWRNFISQVSEHGPDTSAIGDRSPMPGHLSVAASPVPGASRFVATSNPSTPQYHPVSSRPVQKRKREQPEAKSETPRSHPAPFNSTAGSKKAAARDSAHHKPGRTSSSSTSKSQPLSKERITESESESESSGKVRDTIVVAHPRKSHSRLPSSSTPMGRSPRIVVDDPSGLEIDMGSPPAAESSASIRQTHLSREAFRSRTGTPRMGGVSPIPAPKPQGTPSDVRPRLSSKAAADPGNEDEEMEDADVEHLALGSPKQRPQSTPASATVSNQADDDDEDDFAKEFEAALENEDDQQNPEGVGLGIANGTLAAVGDRVMLDEESEVSEEE